MKLAALFEDQETSIQDIILTQFELGQLTYEQALERLKKVTPADQMFFWELELQMADELKQTPEQVAQKYLQQKTTQTLQ